MEDGKQTTQLRLALRAGEKDMRDLIARLNRGIPLATLRAVRDRRIKAPSTIALIESDMFKAAKLLNEANLIISGLVSDNPTFAHREAAFNWIHRNS